MEKAESESDSDTDTEGVNSAGFAGHGTVEVGKLCLGTIAVLLSFIV